MSQQINLLNVALQRSSPVATSVVLASGLGLLAVVLLGWSVWANIELAGLEREAAVVKADLAASTQRKTAAQAAFVAPRKSETLKQEFDLITLQHHNLQQIAALLEPAHGTDSAAGSVAYSAYFRALARRGVAGLWLTGVSIQGNGAAIGLQGRALTASLLPGYLSGLASEPVLRGKRFGQLEVTEPKVQLNSQQNSQQSSQLSSQLSSPLSSQRNETVADAAAALSAPRYVEFSLQAAAAGERNTVEQP